MNYNFGKKISFVLHIVLSLSFVKIRAVFVYSFLYPQYFTDISLGPGDSVVNKMMNCLPTRDYIQKREVMIKNCARAKSFQSCPTLCDPMV